VGWLGMFLGVLGIVLIGLLDEWILFSLHPHSPLLLESGQG